MVLAIATQHKHSNQIYWKFINSCIVLLIGIMIGCQNKALINTEDYRVLEQLIDNPKAEIEEYTAPGVEASTIRRIKVYKYHNDEIHFRSDDSVQENNKTLFYYASLRYNKKGLLIQRNQMYESYAEPRITSFYYDKNQQLIHTGVSDNLKYDTIFTVYYYNDSGAYIQKVQFNNRRSEMSEYQKRDIKYNDGKIGLITYEYGYDTLLNYVWHHNLHLEEDKVVKESYRILVEDSSYNRFEEKLVYQLFHGKPYLISGSSDAKKIFSFYPNGKLKSTFSKNDSVFYNTNGDKERIVNKHMVKRYNYKYDGKGNWILRTCLVGSDIVEIIKRQIEYYKTNSSDETADLGLSARIIGKADSLCSVIEGYAKNKYNKIWLRKNEIKAGKHGKKIVLEKGKQLSDFLPLYWTLVSYDTGRLEPYDSMVTVAVYNTPVTNDDGELLRCLAIFEHDSGYLKPRKQSFKALLMYVDEVFEATSYTVEIENNSICISYQYMRGESYYCFQFDASKSDWALISEGHSGRSYTSAEMNSYDYKTELHHQEIYYLDENSEHKDVDTTYYLKNEPSVSMTD